MHILILILYRGRRYLLFISTSNADILTDREHFSNLCYIRYSLYLCISLSLL